MAAPVPFNFTSSAATIAGDLYLPSGNGPFPTVITAPGFGGVKEMLLPDTDGALDWMNAMAANAKTFKNEVLVSSLLKMATYNTGPAAKKIKLPTLVITAKDDTITPSNSSHDALEGVAGVEFKDFPGTHFGLFADEKAVNGEPGHCEEVVDLTVAHFKKYLLDGGSTTGGVAAGPGPNEPAEGGAEFGGDSAPAIGSAPAPPCTKRNMRRGSRI